MEISIGPPNIAHVGTGVEVMRTERPSIAWAADVLCRQGMPPTEIRSTLRTADPEIVRRHLDLHRERLKEQLDAHLREVDYLERLLGIDRARDIRARH